MRISRCGALSLVSALVVAFSAVFPAAAAAQTGGIGGTVRVDGSVAPNINISVYRNNGGSSQFVAGTGTDASGAYLIQGLVPANGPYYLVTNNSLGIVDEAFGGTVCVNASCGLLSTTSIPVASGINVLGRDFDLAPGGTIGGTVQGPASAPLNGVTVGLYSSTGQSMGAVATNASGAYAFGFGLPAGSYRLATRNTARYVDQLYGGTLCIGFCQPATIAASTPVTVAVGSQTAAHFTLAPGGTISGTITRASNGDPISSAGGLFAEAQFFSSTGQFLTSAVTNVSGVYELSTGLPSGTYYVRSNNNQGFIDVRHAGTPCPGGSCTITAGTPVTVTAPNATTVNFSLAQGGTLAGTVTRASDGTPVGSNSSPMTSVQVYSAAGSFIASSAPNASGNYTLNGLAAGTYYVRTNNSEGLIDQVHSGVNCPGFCQVTTGTAVTVAAGATTTVNFVLARGATLTGTVTAAAGGAPIVATNPNFMNVDLYTSSGQFLMGTQANASGVYTFSTGVPAGNYYLRTNNNLGFVDKLHSGINCPIGSCSVTTGTVVPLTAGSQSTVNFSLDAGGIISGTLTAAGSGTPISGMTNQASVSVYSSGGTFIGSRGTNASGVYTLAGLPAGNYFVRSNNNQGFIDQLHSGIQCAPSPCVTTSGTPVVVQAGVVSTVNFSLQAGGALTGTVTGGGNPVVNSGSNQASVSIFSSSGAFVSSASTNGSGVYTVGGLATGTYYLRTSNNQGFIDQLHSGISCPNANCTVTTGTAVSVTAPGTTTVNFNLVQGGSIAGTILSTTATPIVSTGSSFASAQLYTSGGTFVTSAGTNGSGEYRLTGVAAGTYVLRTSNNQGFVDQLHSGINCPNGGCSVNTGTPITVTAGGTTTVNFTLAPGATITGTMTTTAGAPLVSGGANQASVSILSSSGNFVSSASTDASGVYSVRGLLPGNYYVRTSNNQGFVDQLHNGVACANGTCSVTSVGTLVAASVAAPTTVNFTLSPGAVITGTLTSAATGNPIVTGSGLSMSVSVSSSTGAFLGSASPNSTGVYRVAGLPPGSYFVRTSNNQGFVDQLHSGLSCPNGSCLTTEGTPVVVTAASTTSVDFSLVVGGVITGTVLSSSTTTAVSGLSVSVLSASGNTVNTVGTGTTNASGVYTVRGLPAGAYFVRTSNSAGLVDELYNNVVSLGNSVTTGSAVTVTLGATTSGIDFSLDPGASISGVVTAEGGGTLQNVSVTIVNAANATMRTVSTNASGVYSAIGLPAGTYYLRTSNSLGYTNETYNNKGCFSCNATTTGDPVVVAAGASLTGIDFALPLGGRISGTVTDTTGALLAGVNVSAYTPSGSFQAQANTAADGTYTIQGLLPGMVVLRTFSQGGHLDELYNNIPCLNCGVTAGTQVSVSSGVTTPNINFELAAGGRIAGVVTHAGTGAGVANASVQIYNAQGTQVTSASTNTSGVYLTGGLPTGSYFAVASATSAGLIRELYNDIPCVNCTQSARLNGTPIPVTLGSTVNDINFALSAGGSVTGTVVNLAAEPIVGATIELYSPSNSFVASAQTNAQGVYAVVGLQTGTYFVRTNLSSSLNYLNEVHATPTNRLCNGCNVTDTGSPVSVTVGSATSGINFALQDGGTITGFVREASTNNAIANVSVQVYNSAGNFVKSALTNADGLYSVGGLPGGTFFARTSTSTFVNQVFSAISCASCNPTTGTPIVVTPGQVSAGRNFSLLAGGRIGGVVTSTTGSPLASITVSFTNNTGGSAGSALTNTSGQYTSPALPPGTYFARTTNSLGYINEFFDNLTCLQCTAADGSPITVTAGSTTTADFALAAGGRITGRVTASDTGGALVGAQVSFFTETGLSLGTVSANDAGVYTSTTGLPTGNYFIRTSASGYVRELYNDVQCSGNCTATLGSPIAVTAGETRTGIDVELTLGGRVTGRVTNASGDGVEGVLVTIFERASGLGVATVTTPATGNYTVIGLRAGTYTARTNNSLGLVDELFDDIRCATCAPTVGTGFTVTAGGTTVDINFSLQQGGRISGTVRDSANAVLTGVTVSFYNPQNQVVATAVSNQLGVYTSPGLLAGRYYARTTATGGNFVNQLYSGIPCRTCSANTGTAIDVVGAATTTGIDFTLQLGGSITGTVRNESNTVLEGVTVRILDVDNNTVATAVTNAAGVYTVTALPTNTYYAVTANTLGLMDRIFSNTICLSCSVSAGTPIAVTAGMTSSSIDFVLTGGGRITGTVSGPGGTPLAGVQIEVLGPSGVLVQQLTTDAFGRYVTTVGLPPALYYVATDNSLGFIDKVYNNVVCVACNPLSGTPINVTGSGTISGIDFSLSSGGSITGTVTGAEGPIEGVQVFVHVPTGAVVASLTTSPSGEYRTGSLAPGAYYVRTRNTLGYTDQVFQGRECSSCNPTTGTAVTVGEGVTSGINFTLAFGGRISGRVRDTSGSGIPGVTVRIVTAGGVLLTTGTTDGLGQYTANAGLPTGTYYAQTVNGVGYIDEIFNNVTCIGCSPTTGAPIAVTAGSPTQDINFELVSGGRIAGTITDATTTLPISNSFVNIYASNGLFVTQAVAGSSGQYITSTGLAPGSYFVRAASRLGYISKVWNNISCAACSPIVGTPVVVTADTTTGSINFALVEGGKLSGRVIDAASGAPLLGVTVQTYNGANSLVTTSFTDAAGQFESASGLPVGTYYVRTVNALGYIDEVHANTVCLTCLPNTGTGVAIGAGAEVTGIDFALARGGRITGTVTQTTTNLPLSGVTLTVYDTSGRLVGSPVTDSAGGYTTTGGLPAGNYYVRTNNSLGFLDKVFNDTVCVACDPRLGAPVAVTGTATTPNINFSLAAGGSFSGTVTAGDTSLALGNVQVAIYNAAGSPLGAVTTDGAGQFNGAGLAAGTYYLRTFNLLGYIDEAFDNHACAPCNLLLSTPVTVTAGGATTGRNFVLTKGGLVSGYVIDNATNAPITGVTVSFYTVAGNVFVGRTQPTDDSGYYAISLPVGNYTAVTDAANGYATSSVSSDRRYAKATSAISVQLGQETGGVTFGLEACTPPAFSLTSIGLGRVGVLYNQSITATGGSGALTYSIADGTLTPGLSLSTAGAITGTPSVMGTANFTVGVSDATGCSATQAFVQTTDASAPGAPTNVVGTRGNGQVSVAFTAPLNNGGGTISSYTVTASPDGATATGGGSPIIVTGLTNGTEYTFTVTATNEGGTSVASSASAPVTPATVPLAPIGVVGTAGDREVSVGFAAPSLNGGSPITGYRVTVSPGGATVNGSASPILVTGLTNGTAYTFTVAAINAVGLSTESTASDPVSPVAVPTVSVNPATLNFAAAKAGAGGAISHVTAPQTVTVGFSSGAPEWTLSANQPWVLLSTGAGTGAGTFTIGIQNPSNVLGGSTSVQAEVTLTSVAASNSPRTITVNLTIDQTNGATVSRPFGQVDTPVQNAAGVQGAIGVTGWALDDVGVTGVQVFRNCLSHEEVPGGDCQTILTGTPEEARVVFVGDAAFLAGARPDVAAGFSSFPQAHRGGWGMLMLTPMLPDVGAALAYGGVGPLVVYVVATDVEGNKVLLGRSSDPASPALRTPTSITMANDTIAKPFGSIDTPTLGQTISGVIPNFGWALTPDANTVGSEPGDVLIPTNGSTMWVFIDELPVANVIYNQCRVPGLNAGTFCGDDVSNIFGNPTPQPLGARSSNVTRYRNLDIGRAPIGAYVLDTATLSNGLHTIAWSVTDSLGRVEGIGSRFFTVLNSGAGDPVVSDMRVGSFRLGAQSEAEGPVSVGTAVPFGAVHGRTGFDLNQPWTEMHARTSGRHHVRLPEMGRLELRFGAPVDAGYVVAPDGTWQDLPVGARVNGDRFGWGMPVGYHGTYALVFVRGSERIDVDVTVAPVARTANSEPEVQMHLEAVSENRGLHLQGWAYDSRAALESGIGAVHVWARRIDADTPVFVGEATLAIARPDVAQAHTDAPGHAGFTLTATLAPGTYDISAYAWNTRTARWEEARAVMTVVR